MTILKISKGLSILKKNLTLQRWFLNSNQKWLLKWNKFSLIGLSMCINPSNSKKRLCIWPFCTYSNFNSWKSFAKRSINLLESLVCGLQANMRRYILPHSSIMLKSLPIHTLLLKSKKSKEKYSNRSTLIS